MFLNCSQKKKKKRVIIELLNYLLNGKNLLLWTEIFIFLVLSFGNIRDFQP